jgi:outer membrane immunogenic protein
VVFDPSHRTINAHGWLAGAQIGFNYQLNSLVFGLEADASWTNLKGNGSFNTIPGDVNWAIENQLDWFGTVRGRAGVAVNNFLFYGTAGVAFGQTKAHQVVTNIIPCCLVTAVSSASENHIGWTAGGGVEWMYSRNWSVKVEYLYVDLGSADYRFIGTTFVGTPHTTDSFPADLTFHVVRLGVNYRF